MSSNKETVKLNSLTLNQRILQKKKKNVVKDNILNQVSEGRQLNKDHYEIKIAYNLR